MNPLLALLVIIMAFGVVGRIDYEVALNAAQNAAVTYARSDDAR